MAHFMGRGVLAKAMVISIDKATAVRTFDKVQKHWKVAIAKLRQELAAADPMDKPELEARLQLLRGNGYGGGGLAVPERNRGVQEEGPRHRHPPQADGEGDRPRNQFKNPDDPLRIVFVCAMWITGFDVPSCSTIYLDKPMKNHTLMQTIARANRVWRDKQNGLIVDYVGVFRNLQKALAIYGAAQDGGGPGDTPIHDKSELVRQLREAISSDHRILPGAEDRPGDRSEMPEASSGRS